MTTRAVPLHAFGVDALADEIRRATLADPAVLSCAVQRAERCRDDYLPRYDVIVEMVGWALANTTREIAKRAHLVFRTTSVSATKVCAVVETTFVDGGLRQRLACGHVLTRGAETWHGVKARRQCDECSHEATLALVKKRLAEKARVLEEELRPESAVEEPAAVDFLASLGIGGEKP